MPHLIVHPRETSTFDEFCLLDGPAVALDGYVEGPTRWSRDGMHATFDHHADVDRFATRATCEQVARAIRSRFALVHHPDLAAHVNDPDPDVAFSYFQLQHPELVDHPALRNLVDLEGAVDSSGGTSVAGDPAILEVLAWVADPWACLRDEMPRLSGDRMAEVIEECCERIAAVVDGHPGRYSLGGSYETLAEVAGVWAVVEHHPLARSRVVVDGAEVVVAWRPGPTGDTSAVSVAKATPWVDVDLELVWSELNAAEGIDLTDRDRWGGSDLVGGSPRSAGTRLDVVDICDAVASCYGRRGR